MSGLRTSAIGSGVPSAVSSFLILSAATCGRAEVGDRGGHHDDVGVRARRRSRPRCQLAGADPTRTTSTPAGSGSSTFAATSVTCGTACGRGRGQRVALPAAGPVAQESHRVERLAGAAGADHDAAAGQVAAAAGAQRPRATASSEHLGLGQPARPGVGPGQPAHGRVQHDDAAARAAVATLAWVAGCCHISVCIAGAITTGQVAVSRVAVSRSSARPAPPGPSGRRWRGRRRRGRRRVPSATCSTPATSSQTAVWTGCRRTAPPRWPRRRSSARPRWARPWTSWPDSVSRRSRRAAL